jgi:hypothetical protein
MKKVVFAIYKKIEIYKMAVQYSKRSLQLTTLSIKRPLKIYPKRDFWNEKKTSGTPEFYIMHRLSSSAFWNIDFWVEREFCKKVPSH